MVQILNQIPFFVWPLAVLVVSGLRATKANVVPLAVLLIIPSLFFCGSLYSFLGRFGVAMVPITFWLTGLLLGFALGFRHMQAQPVQFDRQTMSIALQGSWIPLMLSLSIFTLKFSVGMMSALAPEFKDSALILALELFATVILGIFAGRGANCLLRYRQPQT